MAFIQEKLFESGFNLGAPIFVQGGANGKFAISANQIAWGAESTFNGSTFGNTTADLLTAIENSLKNNELKHFTTLALANAFLVAENTIAAEGQIITVGTGEDIVIYLIKSKKENNKTVLFLEEAGSATKVLSSTTEIDAFCSSKNVGKQFFVESDIKNGETLVYGAGMYVVTADKTSVKLSTASDIARLDQQVSNIDNRLTYFLTSENLEGTIDTLNEITYWLDNTDTADLTVSLAELTAYTYNVVAKQADDALAYAKDVLVRANDAYTYAGKALQRANNAYDYANLAYTYSYSVVGKKADNAYAYAGEAYTWAEAAYEYADHVNVNAGNALQRANNAYDYANLTYTYSYSVVGKKADLANAKAIGAYERANNAYTLALSAYTYTHNLATNVVVPHINDNERHVTVTNKAQWDYAYNTIKTFIGSEDIEDTLDTLKEIAYWLDNNEDAADLTVSLAGLTSYTYNVVAKRADASYTWANAAWDYANLAYTYSYDVVAKRADLAYSQSNAAISRISALESIDHNVEITYSVTSATATGYFLASVDVERTQDTNDYKLKYTYAYVPSPKAEDYWEDYYIENVFDITCYQNGSWNTTTYNDMYGTGNVINISQRPYSATYEFIIELDNVTTYPGLLQIDTTPLIIGGKVSHKGININVQGTPGSYNGVIIYGTIENNVTTTSATISLSNDASENAVVFTSVTLNYQNIQPT